MTPITPSQTGEEKQHRLHKPGVGGSNPPAATPYQFAEDSTRIDHCPAEEYHLRPEPSCSDLKLLRESPVEYYWRKIARTAPPRKSDSLDYGTLLHSWAELGEENFWPRTAVAPDSCVTATGALSKKADEWLKSLDPQLIPISPADEKKLRDQTRALLENEDVLAINAARIDAEFNIAWRWNGHACRCRVDGATPDFFFDWKTTSDKNPEKVWFSSVLKWGYHLQSAMYQSAAVAAGWPAHRMVFIVTSTVWPYENCVVHLPEPLIEIGRRECLRLLDELQMRLDLNEWKRLGSRGVRELYCPAWAMKGE